jgi:hypothetical protein
MDKNLAIALAALIASILNCVALGKVFISLGEYKLKVDVMWGFQMRRAEAAGLQNGVLERNSPLSVSERGRKAFDTLLLNQILDYYHTLPSDLDDHDLALKLEAKFGKQISEDVCVPLGAHMGECLIAAVILCREANALKETEAASPKAASV